MWLSRPAFRRAWIRWAWITAITLAFLAGGRAQTGPPGSAAIAQEPDYRYGVKVELVGLYATVQDRSGQLVTGLGKEDFVIYDNGIPQEISQFSSEYVPLSIVILLDNSGSMSGKKLENARKALEQFLKRLDREDEAMLITFQTRPRMEQPFTRNLDRIRRSLKRLEGNGSTALYDAILAALDESRAAGNVRRVLLLISDGVNTYGRNELHDTILQLRRRGVELFAIGIESDAPEDYKYRVITRSILDQLTHSAGGEAFIVSDPRQLGGVCDAVAERMRNQYSFGYYPPETRDGQWRSIRLEARRPGLRVVASKTGYYPSPWPEEEPEPFR